MEDLLKKFGLTDKEIKVFLKLLALGAQPVSVLSKHVGMPRTTLYGILDTLEDKHIVEHFEKFGIKYAKCIPVADLRMLIERKQYELQKTASLLDEKLPELEQLESSHSLTPQIKIYEGKDEVIKMYHRVLKEDGFCAYLHPECVENHMGDFADQIPETIARRKMNVREVLVDCASAYEYQKRFQSSNHTIKILPKNYFFASDTLICHDRVCVVIYDKQAHVAAVEIYNETLRQTQQMTFEALWSTA